MSSADSIKSTSSRWTMAPSINAKRNLFNSCQDLGHSSRGVSPNTRRARKLVQLIPAPDAHFCLVDQDDGKTTSNLDKSARIQRSWPVRTQSQDRNILRKSCLFEEKIKNSNQSHHHHRLRPPFTRYKFGGSQDGESGPMSDPRSWSRSSVSSLESSQEMLNNVSASSAASAPTGDDSSSGQFAANLGVKRSRSFSRRSHSILQKAKIWETVDERPENPYSTLPWSTKFPKKKSFGLDTQPVTKTCSSPNILEMVNNSNNKAEEVVVRRESRRSKFMTELDDNEEVKRNSLPPLFEETLAFASVSNLAKFAPSNKHLPSHTWRPPSPDPKVESGQLRPLEDDANVAKDKISWKSAEILDPFELLESTLTKIDEILINRPEVIDIQEKKSNDANEDAGEKAEAAKCVESPETVISSPNGEEAEEKSQSKLKEQNHTPLVSFPSEEEELEHDAKVSKEFKRRDVIEVSEIVADDVTRHNNKSGQLSLEEISRAVPGQSYPDTESRVKIIDAEQRQLQVPSFVNIVEEETLDLADEVRVQEPIKCDIVIEITPCPETGPTSPTSHLEDQVGVDCNWSSEDDCAIIDDVFISTADNSDDNDDFQVDILDNNNLFLTIPEETEDDQDEPVTDKLKEEDLELVQVSDTSTPECEEVDEYEALRLARLQTQRSVNAPERDVSEDDTETAEFQTRLRQLSLSCGRSVSPTAEEDNQADTETAAESGEVIDDDINDDFLSHLRPVRRFETRESEAPEREIELEDKESAELQTHLRRSRSNDIYLRRRQSKGSLKNNRRSCNLEVLDESEDSQESTGSSKDEEQHQHQYQSRLFRSLSAGSDLDKLKLLAEQTHDIHSLLNLTKIQPLEQHQGTRSPSINRKLHNCESPITASIQSINNLADGVEDLKERLSSHIGIFFPMTAKEQKLESLGVDTDQTKLVKPPLNKKLSRSHSWQGFGDREFKRQLRQQEFWESNRYEQVNASDLNLPPPPATPPVHKRTGPPTSPSSASKTRGRSALSNSINKRYRPLSQSPHRARTQVPAIKPNPNLAEAKEVKTTPDSDSEEEEGMSYECVVTCSVRPNEKILSDLNPEPSNRTDLSPDQIKHLMTVFSNIKNEQEPSAERHVSPEPTEQELQHLMAFMDQEFANNQEAKKEDVNLRNRPMVMPAQGHRQKYLSIIQEEEEGENGSSRPCSRPVSGFEPAKLEATESPDSPDRKEKRKSKNLSEILEHVPPPTDPIPMSPPALEELSSSTGSATYVPGSPEVSKMRLTASSIYPKTTYAPTRPLTRVVASSSPEKSLNLMLVTKAHSESPVRALPPRLSPGDESSKTGWSFEDDMMPDLVMDTKPKLKNLSPSRTKGLPNPLSVMKEKLRNVMGSHKTLNADKESLRGPEVSKKAGDSKVQRFFRSLSWKSSMDEHQDPDSFYEPIDPQPQTFQPEELDFKKRFPKSTNIPRRSSKPTLRKTNSIEK